MSVENTLVGNTTWLYPGKDYLAANGLYYPVKILVGSTYPNIYSFPKDPPNLF